MRRKVQKDLNDTILKNPIYLRAKWSFLESSIIAWSTDYKHYLLKFFSWFIFLSFLIISVLKLEIIKTNAIFFSSWKELMTWQGVFLGGQLTIIAVVYPLVVGFISVLFQDKSAKTIIFPVYKKYSGFMFAGLSGMAFAIFIIGCFFLRSFLDDITYSAFCIASAIWLFCNILMTAWFFTKTFIILNDESRNELITRFSIQEACISDISSRLKISIIKNSKGYDLLKEKDSDILSADSYSYSEIGRIQT